MDVISIILAAAKLVGVSGTLLLAVCQHESGNFTQDYTAMDGGSPSFGSCQIKYGTAKFLGFKGKPKDLMGPKTNSKYSALYLKYQQDRYGSDWVKLAASYNAGMYRPSKKVLGCPMNLKYVKLVQKKLPEKFKNRLNCGK